MFGEVSIQHPLIYHTVNAGRDIYLCLYYKKYCVVVNYSIKDSRSTKSQRKDLTTSNVLNVLVG